MRKCVSADIETQEQRVHVSARESCVGENKPVEARYRNVVRLVARNPCIGHQSVDRSQTVHQTGMQSTSALYIY